MDQAGCTNTGIISNEISDNVCRELCGLQSPNLIDNSDKIFEPYSGVDNYDFYTHDNDEIDIGNTDKCYQHMQSSESNSTTNFVQIKSEPNIFVKSSNHFTCTETEFIGSSSSIQNADASIKMEPITCDTFNHSCCMPTDTLTHKSGENSLHVHEQLDLRTTPFALNTNLIQGQKVSRIPLVVLAVLVGQRSRRTTVISETIVTVIVTVVIFLITS